jgi:hypothetical protein
MAVDEEILEPVAPPGPPEPPPADEQWREDKAGKQYVPRQGKSGIVYRQGDETIEQARARDTAGREKRPKRKTKVPPRTPTPPTLDAKELERALAEAFRTPAIFCAMADDEWATQHFTTAGPYLANQLITASEHNPWLRRKLEEAATGGDAMMKVASLAGVGGALLLYVAPPIIYWFNLPAPESARRRFGIPERKEQPPAYAATPFTPEPPAEPSEHVAA